MSKETDKYQLLLQQKEKRIAQLEEELARERQAAAIMRKGTALVEEIYARSARNDAHTNLNNDSNRDAHIDLNNNSRS